MDIEIIYDKCASMKLGKDNLFNNCTMNFHLEELGLNSFFRHFAQNEFPVNCRKE